MISGTAPATPSRISTSSYFSTPKMTMTQTREATTETDTMGETNFKRVFCVVLDYIDRQCIQSEIISI